MEKKGQFQSMVLIVISIFIVAVVLLFMNHMNVEIYSSLDEYFLTSDDYNQTEAHNVTTQLLDLEKTNMWDWAFLAIFIGLVIQMLLLSFASRVNVAFFWIFVLLSILILIIGVILSNIWQEIAANPEFATTILRFPIANTLLGTFYPTAITAILFLGMIILFGKFPGQQTQ